jgi:hypothetical protein
MLTGQRYDIASFPSGLLAPIRVQGPAYEVMAVDLTTVPTYCCFVMTVEIRDRQIARGENYTGRHTILAPAP